MTSFVDILHLFENPFAELIVVTINVVCFFSLLGKAEMSRKWLVVPALPYLAMMGINLYGWSTVHWTSHVPINSFGFLPSLNFALGVRGSDIEPFWLEFLFYLGIVTLVLNWAMYMYMCVASWPVLRAKEDLEAAVGRQSGRQAGGRSSAFLGESGLEASAPVAALLNRPPGSKLDKAMAGSVPNNARAQSDAQRVAELQRQVQAGMTTQPSSSAAPGGVASAPTARPPVGDAARVAELISSMQPPVAPSTLAPSTVPTITEHCTVCGAQLIGTGQHSCPLAGGQSMFCGRCGTPHDRTIATCGHCGSPL
jgi:hypothetical protein